MPDYIDYLNDNGFGGIDGLVGGGYKPQVSPGSITQDDGSDLEETRMSRAFNTHANNCPCCLNAECICTTPQDQTQEALDAADNAVIEAKMKQVFKENRPLSDQTPHKDECQYCHFCLEDPCRVGTNDSCTQCSSIAKAKERWRIEALQAVANKRRDPDESLGDTLYEEIDGLKALSQTSSKDKETV